MSEPLTLTLLAGQTAEAVDAGGLTWLRCLRMAPSPRPLRCIVCAAEINGAGWVRSYGSDYLAACLGCVRLVRP